MADVPETRAALEKTGNLYTEDAEDLGHVSAFWRARIVELCDELEAKVPSFDDRPPSEQVAALADSVRQVLGFDEILAERLAMAVHLVEEAAPRMRTLNNAASARWFEMYGRFSGASK